MSQLDPFFRQQHPLGRFQAFIELADSPDAFPADDLSMCDNPHGIIDDTAPEKFGAKVRVIPKLEILDPAPPTPSGLVRIIPYALLAPVAGARTAKVRIIPLAVVTFNGAFPVSPNFVMASLLPIGRSMAFVMGMKTVSKVAFVMSSPDAALFGIKPWFAMTTRKDNAVSFVMGNYGSLPPSKVCFVMFTKTPTITGTTPCDLAQAIAWGVTYSFSLESTVQAWFVLPFLSFPNGGWINVLIDWGGYTGGSLRIDIGPDCSHLTILGTTAMNPPHLFVDVPAGTSGHVFLIWTPNIYATTTITFTAFAHLY